MVKKLGHYNARINRGTIGLHNIYGTGARRMCQAELLKYVTNINQ